MAPRILLADDSPHAQRMGERILREEGFEVVTVTDGATVLHRLDDVSPDVILLDAFLTDHSGFELCRLIKGDIRHEHAGVILVAGLLEPVSDEEAKAAGADAVLKKPFEATAVIEAIRPLVEKARAARTAASDAKPSEAAETAKAIAVLETEAPLPSGAAPGVTPPPPSPAPVEAPAATAAVTPVEPPSRTVESTSTHVESHVDLTSTHVGATSRDALDPEIVRAAVTIALERAFPSLVDEITRKVIDSLPSPDGPGASNKV